MKTLAALMNTEGGSLLVGVADDGSALGLERDFSTLRQQNRDGFELAIMTAISSMLGRPQCAKVTILFPEFGGKEICHILVSSSSKPVFCEIGKETKFYLRAGAGTRELNVRETSEYVAAHW